MVDHAIEHVIRSYARAARAAGVPVARIYLLGSYARGQARPDSDVDVMVTVEDLDGEPERALAGRLWRLRATTDSRIEPVWTTRAMWTSDNSSLILEAAKRDAIEIELKNPGIVCAVQ